MGIEPTALAWEARVLPLYDARVAADSSATFDGRHTPAILIVDRDSRVETVCYDGGSAPMRALSTSVIP
jgi:hypothetical protein